MLTLMRELEWSVVMVTVMISTPMCDFDVGKVLDRVMGVV